MALEFAARRQSGGQIYPYAMMAAGSNGFVVDWAPMIKALIEDCRQGISAESMARAFHETLAEMIVEAAQRAGLSRVVLSGGCFQNKLLTERTIHRLKDAGFEPFSHKDLPPNDGSLAAGQLAVAVARREKICV